MVRKGEDAAQKAGSNEGKFGRMFDLPAAEASEDALAELGRAMNEGDAAGAAAGNNDNIPAGFTYLGQFIDHDITFDPTSLKERQIDLDALENFRSPAFDLDSMYGGGRATQPYLYLRRSEDSDLFEIGMTNPLPGPVQDQALRKSYPNDLPRAANGLAIIPDPRNDENLVVAQLHLAFMKFHNKVVAGIKDGSIVDPPRNGESVFDHARRLVMWHYQWIVIHEFLETVLHPVEHHLITDLDAPPTIIEGAHYPFIPVEFSMAAYRFGHSMVRQRYRHNRVFPGATLAQLFDFTGRSSDPASGSKRTPIPSNWIIDWRGFFAIPGVQPAVPSRSINTLLAPELFALRNVAAPPGGDPADTSPELSVRNLIRGKRAGLPSGQAVADAFEMTKLDPSQLADDTAGGRVLAAHPELLENTPLWFYILKESEVEMRGQRLGQVGSRIVAQTFLGLLRKDKQSYLSVDRNWAPTELPAAHPRSFTMADLLTFVGEINPLGDGAPAPLPAVVPRPVVAVV
jgi:hypothetical protein